MGQLESQPAAAWEGSLAPSPAGGDVEAELLRPQSSGKKGPSPPQHQMHPRPRNKSIPDNDNSSQASTARSSFAGKSARSPLSWAVAGMELMANATADVALTTVSAAMKTASVLASTTEAAANVVANTTTNVALNTASVATQTASLITTVTSAGAKTAGDAIAGTASLVVEGFAGGGIPNNSPKHMTSRDGRTRSRSGDSISGTGSPSARPAFFATTVGRPSQDLMLPEAMALGSTMSSSGSHDNLVDAEQKAPMRNVGTRFWCMVGATNVSARKHWVATVTNSKPSAPSAKYLRKILTLAWETKGQSIDEYYKLLQMRPITTSPNCALKALITSLRIVREGPPEALATSISNVGLIDAVGASWAARVLLDVSPDELVATSTTLSGPQTMSPSLISPNSKQQQHPPVTPRPSSPAGTSALNKELMEQMLIARLSGLIVQKMHFHSMRRSLNARYEKSAPSPTMGMLKTSETSLGDPGEARQPYQDVWEDDVQLASALLTLLGTIEGIVRLALGMAGNKPSLGPLASETPSPATLSLCTLLIEEALSAFDALSESLAQLANAQSKDQDQTVVRSLMTRYHDAYQGMRSYCAVAREYPYVLALNKVPLLEEEQISPRENGAGTIYSRLSISAAPPSLHGQQPSSPEIVKSSSSATVGGGSRSSVSIPQLVPSLASRPFTRRSILETLEEEEALETRLVSSKILKPEEAEDPGMQTPQHPSSTARDRLAQSTTTTMKPSDGQSLTVGNDTKALLGSSSIDPAAKATVGASIDAGSESNDGGVRTPSAGGRKPNLALPPLLNGNDNRDEDSGPDPSSDPQRMEMMFSPWGFGSNSIEHAKPPSSFHLEVEEEEDMSDFDLANDVDDDDVCADEGGAEDEQDPRQQQQQQQGADGVGLIRTRTLGNPFDTGNSSIILLAEAHRSAFSTISNPFASGQFNAFATNQLLSNKRHYLHSQQQVAMGSAFQQLPVPSADQQQQQQQQQQPWVSSQKHREEATKRALQQCERLFEVSGINLNQEDLVISKDVLGRGAFSIVRRGTVKVTGQEVAVKELLIEEWGRSPETILDFRAEVAVMKAVHHPNVLQLVGACTSPKLCLISEFCHRGNLFDLLYADRSSHPTASRTLHWQLRLKMAIGEARGMHFLHTAFPAPLIHRDLKSLNLLLSKNWTLKVSDFGLSRFRRRGVAEGPCGTTQWMAPEVIEGKNYDESADVYSFGINLWELSTRRVPWEGVAPDQVKLRVVRGERLDVRPSVLDQNCPPQLVELMQRCWAQNPVDRPDFGTIVNELKVIAATLA